MPRRTLLAAAALLVAAVAALGAYLHWHDKEVPPPKAIPGTPARAGLPAFDRFPPCHFPARQDAPAPDAQLVGIHSNLRFQSPTGVCARLEKTRLSGARLIREDFTWAGVEPRPGHFDWARWDAITEAAARFGMTLLPILDGPPGWAGPSLGAYPRRPETFARYVAAVVRRYGPDGDFWRAHPDFAAYAPRAFDLWNEPYQASFSGGRPDPGFYGRMVEAAVAAGRRANPRARFLVEADRRYHVGRGKRNWLEDLYKARPGIARFIDGLSVHPYTRFAPRDRVSESDRDGSYARVEDLRSFLDSHGGRGKPIWITEIGWPTCTPDIRPQCVSEAEQPRRLSQAFDVARTRWRAWVPAVVVYALEDAPDQPPPERFWGVLRADGAPKPGLAAVQAAAHR